MDVTFTSEELKELQLSAVDKMLELNRKLIEHDDIEEDEALKEISTLGSAVEKCSKLLSN